MALQDEADMVDDGGVDACPARALVGAVGRGDAFGDHVHGTDNLSQRFPFAQTFPNSSVAAVFGKTGNHQVTDTAEALKGFGLSSQRAAQTHELCEGTRDKRRFGIVPEAQAIAYTGGQGEHIFERAAELDAGDVAAGVGAEGRVAKNALQGAEELRLGAPKNHGRRGKTGDFFGVTRTGEHREGMARQGFLQNLAHAQTAAALDSFGTGKEHGVCSESNGAQTGGHLAHGARGRHQQKQLGVRERGEGGRQVDRFGQGNPWQIGPVFSLFFQPFEGLGIVSPEGHGAAVTLEQESEGGTPASGANHADFLEIRAHPQALGAPNRFSVPANKRRMLSRCRRTTKNAAAQENAK